MNQGPLHFLRKGRNQLNRFELKKKRNVSLCYNFSPKYQTKPRKKNCLHCSVLWGVRGLYSFVQTVKLHLFTGTAEEQLDNGDFCVYTVY